MSMLPTSKFTALGSNFKSLASAKYYFSISEFGRRFPYDFWPYPPLTMRAYHHPPPPLPMRDVEGWKEGRRGREGERGREGNREGG
jgi:hypothetical protein